MDERAPVTARELERDTQAWDRFVASSQAPTYLQDSSWATIKEPNGWASLRAAAGEGDGLIGAQVLVKRRRPIPWGLGYAPRGPVSAAPLDPASLGAITDRLRRLGKSMRVATIRIEPDAEPGSSVEEALKGAGWKPSDSIQPPSTRVIDLTKEEEALWSALRSSARWSVNKSRRSGVTVVEGDGSRLDDFYAIHTDAMHRGGVVPRDIRTYRDTWTELAPKGMARLLFAESSGGQAVATVFLVSSGPRIVDLYSGTIEEGDRLRANYLLKWEALVRSKGWGFREYDFWGMPRAGIAEFKAAFGGREVHYVGAWELEVDPIGAKVLRLAQGARKRYLQLRRRRGTETD